MRPQSEYGALPHEIGKFEFDLPEHMSYLYLPVHLPDSTSIYLPDNLQVISALVVGLVNLYGREDDYVYVTAKRGYGVLSRPGWHSDGFGTDDRNVLWSKGAPTVFSCEDFGEVPTGHAEAMEHFTRVADAGNTLTYPDQSALMVNDKVVHRPPVGHEGPRQFVKVSFSPNRYNLEGNSHNYMFNYDWPMYERDAVRNMENVEELDSVTDPRMLP